MNERKKPEPVQVQNPRYEGATPDMVALALLRAKPDEPKRDDETPAEGAWPSSISQVYNSLPKGVVEAT